MKSTEPRRPAAQVDRHRAIELLRIELDEAVVGRDPDVVDDQLDRTAREQGLGQRDGVVLAHVGAHELEPLTCEGLRLVAKVAVDHGHLRVRGSQPARDGQTDPVRCAGDDRAPPGEIGRECEGLGHSCARPPGRATIRRRGSARKGVCGPIREGINPFWGQSGFPHPLYSPDRLFLR